MLFVTNRCCSVPLHILLTDLTDSQGGSYEVIRILNRLGAVASVDIHRCCIRTVLSGAKNVCRCSPEPRFEPVHCNIGRQYWLPTAAFLCLQWRAGKKLAWNKHRWFSLFWHRKLGLWMRTGRTLDETQITCVPQKVVVWRKVTCAPLLLTVG